MKKFLLLLLFTSMAVMATSTRIIDADQIRSSDQTKTWTPPSATDTLIGRDSTDTVTNKSISGSSNTLTNIPLSTAVTGVLPLANGGTGVDASSTAPSFYNQILTESTYGNFNVGKEMTIFQSTGILNGGALTIDTDTTKFDLAAGEGWIVNSTNLALPAKTRVTWSAFDAQTVTNLATQDVTYILINSSGAIVQQSTEPTSAQKRSNIYIGRLNHFNRTSISFADTLADMLQSPMSQLFDLMDSIGPFNKTGNEITANGANLSMNKAAGTLFVPSYNYISNNQSPNVVDLIGRTAFTFRYATQTTLAGSSVSVINPASYDNAGTITTVPANGNATIQRVFLFPSNNLTVQYGQTVYANFSEALQAVSRDPFVITPTVKGVGVPAAYVVITKACTSLQDIACSAIIPASRFGSPSGAIGGTTTMQQSYNNSNAPQITTDAIRGAVEYKRGSAADTDLVLKVLNGAGDTKFSVKGNGDTTVSGNFFSGPQVVTGSVGISETISAFNLSGTNTGDLTSRSQSEGADTTVNKVETYNYGLTTTATGTRLVESYAPGMLVNPSFEGLDTSGVANGWTNSSTNSTATITTTASEITLGKKAQKIALASGVLNFFQDVNIPSGISKQGYADIYYNVPAAWLDFSICIRKNGADDFCTTPGRLAQNGTYQSIKIPLEFGTTSVGVKFKTTSAVTGDFLTDLATVRLGLPEGSVKTDTEFSAKVSSTGVVSNENINFIQGDCTNANPTVCTLVNGFVTVPMNCTATSSSGTNWSLTQNNGSTTTTLTFYRIISGAASSDSFNIICQKTGVDYERASARIYEQSNANFGYTNSGTITITATTTNPTKGTVVTDRVFASRDGQRLKAIYQYDQTTGGSNGSGEYLFSLPSGLSFDSSVVSFYTGAQFGASENKAIVGWGKINTGSSTSTFVSLVAYDSTRFRVYAVDSTSVRGYIGSAFYALSGAVGLGFNLDAPINGWPEGNTMVGSFANIEKCANDDECIQSYVVESSSRTTIAKTNSPGWVTSIGAASGGVSAISIASGRFTVPPSCGCEIINGSDGGDRTCQVVSGSVTTTSLSVMTTGNGSSNGTYDFRLTCDKVGVDSKPKTAKVATSIGVPTVPGIVGISTGERIDTFSVSYGDTSLTNVCTGAGNCYIDQFGQTAGASNQGGAVQKIVWNSTGVYTMTTNKTYSKLKCQVGYVPGASWGSQNVISCSNCNTASFQTVTTTPALTDSYGMLMCQGSY